MGDDLRVGSFLVDGPAAGGAAGRIADLAVDSRRVFGKEQTRVCTLPTRRIPSVARPTGVSGETIQIADLRHPNDCAT